MKIELGATIPTVQYGNLQPKLELETTKENYDRDMRALEGKMKELWDRYSEKPLTTHGEALGSTTDDFVTITPFVGKDFLYNDYRHEYRTLDGKPMLSGSAFAEQYTKPFNKEAILPVFAKKHGVNPALIGDMWRLKAEVSTTFGTAIHKALEFVGKHGDTMVATSTEFTMHPTIKPIVEAFYRGRENERAEYEIFVEHDGKVGQIDRLIITGDKRCIIEDWKTNADMDKGSGKMLAPYEKLSDTAINHYRLQLTFYKKIMEGNGWIVEELRLQHWTDKWTPIKVEAI